MSLYEHYKQLNMTRAINRAKAKSIDDMLDNGISATTPIGSFTAEDSDVNLEIVMEALKDKLHIGTIIQLADASGMLDNVETMLDTLDAMKGIEINQDKLMTTVDLTDVGPTPVNVLDIPLKDAVEYMTDVIPNGELFVTRIREFGMPKIMPTSADDYYTLRQVVKLLSEGTVIKSYRDNALRTLRATLTENGRVTTDHTSYRVLMLPENPGLVNLLDTVRYFTT